MLELGKLFRGLIFLQLVTFTVALILVPDDPAAYQEPFGIVDIASLIYLPLWLTCLVLLFRFRPSGKVLFTVLIFAGLVLSLGAPGASVPNGNLLEIVNWFGGALDGAMLAILYLTDLKDRFLENA